jgi:hypothetical protein
VHLCLEVEDIPALRTTLIARGIETTKLLFGIDSSWKMWCKDPDGTPIEFYQSTAQSNQFTGQDCPVNW